MVLESIYIDSGLKAAITRCVGAAGNEQVFTEAVEALIVLLDELPQKVSQLARSHNVSEVYVASAIQLLTSSLHAIFFNKDRIIMPGGFSAN